MHLPLFIARRYLFARKSHNVINVISAISATGIAVGSAALIIILSVYNGFGALVRTMVSSVEPDLAIVPAQGKFFVPEGDVFDWLYTDPRIRTMCTALQDNIFISYENRQGTALAKGVDTVYEEETPLAQYVTDGEFRLRMNQRRYAAVGRGFARMMGINRRFVAGLELYYPERGARISVANPMASVNNVTVWPSCEFAVNSDIDNRLIIISRDVMCELTGCTDEVSAVELRVAESVTPRGLRALKREIASRLDTGLRVLDRTEQNPSLYKMLRYEKLSVYLIMIFVVIMLGFSIFGSLSMLIIEKKEDIATLEAIGADKRLIRKIFTLEGWLITVLGMVAGLAAGIVFCLLQQRYGFIKMPGNYVISAYPMLLQWSDVLTAAASITLLGWITALIPARSISRTRRTRIYG